MAYLSHRFEAPWPVVAYLLMSAVTFVAYALDKHAAQREKWRTPEATLQMLALLGGWPGAFAAQRILRHKTRKVGFQIVFWIIGVAHAAFWIWFRFGGDRTPV